MQTRNEVYEIFDGKLKITAAVPCTAEDYDAMSGQPGACVSDALKYSAYRAYLSRIRAAVCDALHEKGGEFIRKSETKDEKTTWESEADYVKRLLVSGTISPADLQSEGDAAVTAAGVTFQSALTGGSNTRSAVGKKFMDKAREAIEAWETGTNALGQPASTAKTLAAIQEYLPGAALADPTSVEEVARLFRDYDAAFQKKMASAVI